MHHHEVVDVNVQHCFNVLARRFVEPLNRERTRSGDYKTDVQILNLHCEVVVILGGQGLPASEVNLNHAGLGLGAQLLDICANSGEFIGVA